MILSKRIDIISVENVTGVIGKIIPEIIRRAIKEANPTYPVPVIWDKEQFRNVIQQL